MTFHFGSDSRSFTDYRSSCSLDAQIMKENNLKTPAEYRLFIQRNGNSMMSINKKLSEEKVKKDLNLQ